MKDRIKPDQFSYNYMKTVWKMQDELKTPEQVYESYEYDVVWWMKSRGPILWIAVILATVGGFSFSIPAGVITFIVSCILALIANIVVDALLRLHGEGLEEDMNIDTSEATEALKNDMAATAIMTGTAIAASAHKAKKGLDEIKDPDRWHKI